MTLSDIPSGLRPHFKEYDVRTLVIDRDANLIIQRTLEYGTWDEVRWLFGTDPAGCSCIHYARRQDLLGQTLAELEGDLFTRGQSGAPLCPLTLLGAGWTKNPSWCIICPGFANIDRKETEVGSDRGSA